MSLRVASVHVQCPTCTLCFSMKWKLGHEDSPAVFLRGCMEAYFTCPSCQTERRLMHFPVDPDFSAPLMILKSEPESAGHNGVTKQKRAASAAARRSRGK